jgi:hypothetical protein
MTGAIAAIAIAWPWGQPVARDTQELARSIQYALPPVDPLAVGSPDGAERRSILGYAFPPEWQVEDTSVKWGFDVVALAYYVQRFANEGRTSRADYRVQPAADPAPGGWTPGRVSASLALFIRDPAAHEARVNHPPSTDFASPVYRIRREQLLKFLGTRVPIHEIDLRDVFERITGR